MISAFGLGCVLTSVFALLMFIIKPNGIELIVSSGIFYGIVVYVDHWLLKQHQDTLEQNTENLLKEAMENQNKMFTTMVMLKESHLKLIEMYNGLVEAYDEATNDHLLIPAEVVYDYVFELKKTGLSSKKVSNHLFEKFGVDIKVRYKKDKVFLTNETVAKIQMKKTANAQETTNSEES